MSRKIVILALALVALRLASGERAADAQDEDAAALTVTSRVDETGGSTACPHESRCTLRRALETANARPGDDPVRIDFEPDLFPISSPARIQLVSPLPPLTRANAALDGSTAGVSIDGSNLAVEADGLRVSGAAVSVKGIGFRGFTRACLALLGVEGTIGGDRDRGEANRLDACPIGMIVSGIDATVVGNVIGLEGGTKDIPGVEVGILVLASDVALGPDSPSAVRANLIGNTAIAIQVGDGSAGSLSGVSVRNNILGLAENGSAASNGIGVQVRPTASDIRIESNLIARATVAGVQLTPNDGPRRTERVVIQGNRFANLSALAIDLGANGVRDTNDSGDGDVGPNGLINHPVIDRATQASLAGTVGATCGGCRVDLYLAEHIPGTDRDYGRTPLAGGSLVTDANGDFGIEAPPVTPGSWIIATVTDPLGNTSEFGPAARVGAGLLQCGNLTLRRGWNHAGYFGTESIQLGANFPPQGGGRVSAIYRLTSGGDSYLHWIAEAPFTGTLATLDPGVSYWFLVDEPVTFQTGFALTIALPVLLEAGWNDFVYFGPTVSVVDALGPALASVVELYRYVNDGPDSGWRSWGGPATPDWARELSQLDACGAYAIRVSAATTLMPPQP